MIVFNGIENFQIPIIFTQNFLMLNVHQAITLNKKESKEIITLSMYLISNSGFNEQAK